MADIHKLIGAIVPDVYCAASAREKVKATIKELGPEKGYQAAAEFVKLVEHNNLFKYDEAKMKPLDLEGLKSPSQVHKLTYDSAAESLEPLYFWILDYVNSNYRKVYKLTDNFTSSVGSSHFSELGGKATLMQKEAMNTFGAVNQVLKSVLNILYDLKDFRIRIQLYKDYKSNNPAKKASALLSLKQVWLDKVDITRGTTSIKGLAQQFDYVTLIDAFMATDSLEQLKKSEKEGGIDLNDRVKRILEQRVGEFLSWIKISESELTKRYEIEKRYLRSQYNTLQLYSRWVQPYLRAARKLEQNQGLSSDAALVSTFNTTLLELILLAQTEYDPTDDINLGDLPELFRHLKTRKYFSVLVMEVRFRGIPQRVGQGYSYGGRTEITFTSYGLREDEIEIVKKEMAKDDFNSVLSLIEGSTKESLDQIKDDIDSFLNEDKEKEGDKNYGEEAEQSEKEKSEDVNPFSGLFSVFFSGFSLFKSDEKSGKDKGKSKAEEVPDTHYEKILRSRASLEARDKCKNVFETYKKAHNMPAF